MTKEQALEIVRLEGKLDSLLYTLDVWNRKEITSDEAFKRFFQYVTQEEILGMRKRYELRRKSVVLA